MIFGTIWIELVNIPRLAIFFVRSELVEAWRKKARLS